MRKSSTSSFPHFIESTRSRLDPRDPMWGSARMSAIGQLRRRWCAGRAQIQLIPPLGTPNSDAQHPTLPQTFPLDGPEAGTREIPKMNARVEPRSLEHADDDDDSSTWSLLPRDIICEHFAALPELRMVNRHWCAALSPQIKSLKIWERKASKPGGSRSSRDERRNRLGHVESVTVKDRCFGVFDLSSITPFARVESLDLTKTQVGNVGCELLKSFKSLRKLVMIGTKISNEGCQHLASMPTLTDLQLGGTAINDDGIIHLSKLVNLIHLNLVETNFTDYGCEVFRSLSNLKKLELNETKVGDVGCKGIATLPSLESLDLFKTNVGDEGCGLISRMKSLTSLNLSWTPVGDDGAMMLSKLENLCELMIHATAIVDEASVEDVLCESQNLHILVTSVLVVNQK